jgi:hypothetical protein
MTASLFYRARGVGGRSDGSHLAWTASRPPIGSMAVLTSQLGVSVSFFTSIEVAPNQLL